MRRIICDARRISANAWPRRLLPVSYKVGSNAKFQSHVDYSSDKFIASAPEFKSAAQNAAANPINATRCGERN